MEPNASTADGNIGRAGTKVVTTAMREAGADVLSDYDLSCSHSEKKGSADWTKRLFCEDHVGLLPLRSASQ